MGCILSIESAVTSASVAVSQDGALLFDKQDNEARSHASMLGVFVDQALSFIDSRGLALDAVAVSKGPGSYTGLRVGVSMAKGICYGRGVRLLGIPTLQVLCVPTLLYADLPENALLCPMIDARRMEVYSALYDRSLKEMMPTSAVVIDKDSFKDVLDRQPVWFMGDGAEKCKGVIVHENAHFVDGAVPSAKSMFVLAEKAFNQGEFQDIAYFEPFYLKDFIAIKPKPLF
ncbi:MAG: tRNA (adenosine(37)-N6)-threonylcarbamoyltransferase complex dimerization subunit type 1 TsaB [Bacteroidaceae bacterium]|nr:tRNA (adenosine(37)-N6)-threonylcarbamoyltransferase complex dimerization subunit type 1 TsaB [Bacteroidaceae bacterium]